MSTCVRTILLQQYRFNPNSSSASLAFIFDYPSAVFCPSSTPCCFFCSTSAK